MPVVWCTDAYSEDIHNSPLDSHPDMQSLPHEGELDFYETNCHWQGCGLEFDTQDDLVRVSFDVFLDVNDGLSDIDVPGDHLMHIHPGLSRTVA